MGLGQVWIEKRRAISGLASLAAAFLLLSLVGCDLPRVQAEDRLFLPLSVEVLDEYVLDRSEFEGTAIGGLSALDYDRPSGTFYALSDDRGFENRVRFYTLSLDINAPDAGADSSANSNADLDAPPHATFEIEKVTPTDVVFLSDESGEPFAPGTVDPEGLALSPDGTLWIASEGVASAGIAPFIGEFDRDSGQQIRQLPLPPYVIPDAAGEEQALGVQNNLGFEALTVGGVGSGEPYRLFAATEAALLQDAAVENAEGERAAPDLGKNRLLHYVLVEERTQFVAEHLYPLDAPPSLLTVSNGLVELLSLDGATALRATPGGYFLSLERTYGAAGFGVKLFQTAIASATDVSTLTYLQGDPSGFQPLRKRLLLDFSDPELDLDITPDNLEGMTFGPRLRDGSQSLILVSDNNFNDEQKTQFLLLSLRED